MISFLTWLVIFNQGSAPIGTVKIKDFYVDKTEILNIHWLEYIHYQEQEVDMRYLRTLLPDSSNIWYNATDHRREPIVLITYEQAVAYCEWRSKAVSKKTGKKVTYRLPTPDEWKVIAGEILRTDQKLADKELKAMQKQVEKDPKEYLLIALTEPKNRVYNFFDNVSEMTSEKSVAMGANNSELTDLQSNLTRTITYNGANKYVGFRCIAEVE